MKAYNRDGNEIRTISLTTHIATVGLVCSISLAVIGLLAGKAWGRQEILSQIVTQAEFMHWREQHAETRQAVVDALVQRINRNEERLDLIAADLNPRYRGTARRDP